MIVYRVLAPFPPYVCVCTGRWQHPSLVGLVSLAGSNSPCNVGGWWFDPRLGHNCQQEFKILRMVTSSCARDVIGAGGSRAGGGCPLAEWTLKDHELRGRIPDLQIGLRNNEYDEPVLPERTGQQRLCPADLC